MGLWLEFRWDISLEMEPKGERVPKGELAHDALGFDHRGSLVRGVWVGVAEFSSP